MQLADLDPDTDSLGFALRLLRTYGDRARPLAEEQRVKAAENPQVAARWRAVIEAVTALELANWHIEVALDLLDSVNETSAPPLLEHAISILGVRQFGRLHDEQTELSSTTEADFYGQRTHEHLAVARLTTDRVIKTIHLNIASRCATRREHALR